MGFDTRRLKNLYKHGLRKLFELGQHLGFDVLPRHFYSEVPDIRVLRNTSEWKRPYSMIGVNGADALEQIRFVAECCSPSIVEEVRCRDIHAEASLRNGEVGFGPVEADFLFAFVATQKPSQIFQIGCGVSTSVCLMAAEHAGYTPEIICAEPYPTDFLLHEADRGHIKLIRQKAQSLDLTIIDGLNDDALFFVDSTHTLGPAGEVSRIILEMLPRLKPGASVHFHDILFPYDYSRKILSDQLFFWHESVLLHAFLTNNNKFRITASLSMIHYSCSEKLSDYLPNYKPDNNEEEGLGKGEGHFPSSTYLEVIDGGRKSS